jgi:hypothetical protein
MSLDISAEPLEQFELTSIAQGGAWLFIQDSYKWRPNLVVKLGLRYEWNMTPTERY